MRSPRKWKKDLVSIGFPNCDKLSDDNILDMIYTDVPGRIELLKWIASQMIEGEDKKVDLSKEDLAKFFCDHNMLQKVNADDFIHAKCNEKEQKNNWKILFSITRMKMHFSSSKKGHIKHKKREKKLEFPEKGKLNSIKEMDSESQCEIDQNVEKEETRKELKKRSKHKASNHKLAEVEEKPTENSQKKLVQFGARHGKKPDLNTEHQLETYSSTFKPLFSTPNMDEFIYDYRSKQVEMYDEASGQENMINDNPGLANQPFPRIFIPPGAPPLGKLDKDPHKYKIKMEESAPPITFDGEPHFDNSCWLYKVYDLKKVK